MAQESFDRLVLIQYFFITIGIIILFLFLIIIGGKYFSNKFASYIIVLLILILFEFALLIVDPIIERLVGATPLPLLVANIILAVLFIPIHSTVEKKLNLYIQRKKGTIEAEEKGLAGS